MKLANRFTVLLNLIAVTAVSVGPAMRTANAAAPVSVTQDGIPIVAELGEVRLQCDGTLRGALVDVNGRPIAASPIAVGQAGQVVATTSTDAQGRYTVAGLTTGTYQISSYAGVQSYRVWDATTAPQQARQGVIQVVPETTVRGAGFNLPFWNGPGSGRHPVIAALTHPLVLTGVVIATVATVVAVAADDDDAS